MSPVYQLGILGYMMRALQAVVQWWMEGDQSTNNGIRVPENPVFHCCDILLKMKEENPMCLCNEESQWTPPF